MNGGSQSTEQPSPQLCGGSMTVIQELKFDVATSRPSSLQGPFTSAEQLCSRLQTKGIAGFLFHPPFEYAKRGCLLLIPARVKQTPDPKLEACCTARQE